MRSRQGLPVWRCFQIFDDRRFNTSVANAAMNIARRAAVRVVVDSNFVPATVSVTRLANWVRSGIWAMSRCSVGGCVRLE